MNVHEFESYMQISSKNLNFTVLSLLRDPGQPRNYCNCGTLQGKEAGEGCRPQKKQLYDIQPGGAAPVPQAHLLAF